MERRGFLLGLGALAISPGLARAQPAVLDRAFALERVLVRGLADGKRITVTRRWKIAFSPADAGWLRVTGEQDFVEVDAPAALQALARLEENREEAGLFPRLLDEEGRISDSADSVRLDPLPEEVVDAALVFAKTRMVEEEATLASRRFVSDISHSGHEWLTRLPADLFFPLPRERSASREIVLPDGTEGTVEMSETARARDGSGLLESFRREVRTRTANVERGGSDTWRLSQPVS